jgi:hypothetical protein
VQQQAQVQDAHQEHHGLGVDVVVDGAVATGRAGQRRDPPAPRRVGFGQGLGHLGLAPGGDVGLEAQGLGVAQRAAGAGGPGGDEVGHAVEPVGAEPGRAVGAGDDRLAQQVVLGAEAAVDGAGRQPGLPHDVHDLGAVVALSGEHRGGGAQQALPQLVVIRGVGRSIAHALKNKRSSPPVNRSRP